MRDETEGGKTATKGDIYGERREHRPMENMMKEVRVSEG
jgi:hypothetical protein